MPRKTAVLYSLCLCIAVCLFLSLGCTAPGAESLGSVSEPDENGFRTCVYKDVKRKFLLYIPENASKGAPLLFMLHGYGDAADVFADTTGMAAAANARGYAVVYPQGLGDPSDKTSAACWNFDGKKDGNDDVGFLTALAHYLQSTYGFNKKATFVTGFSNGAFMTYRLAGDAPKTFRAVASVSGTMGMTTWKERMGKAGAAILQITGTKDDLVGRARSARRRGGDRLLEGGKRPWRRGNRTAFPADVAFALRQRKARQSALEYRDRKRAARLAAGVVFRRRRQRGHTGFLRRGTGHKIEAKKRAQITNPHLRSARTVVILLGYVIL